MTACRKLLTHELVGSVSDEEIAAILGDPWNETDVTSLEEARANVILIQRQANVILQANVKPGGAARLYIVPWLITTLETGTCD